MIGFMTFEQKESNARKRFFKNTFLGSPDGCWYWLGYTDKDGYGQMLYHDKVMRAHRMSYLFHKGNVPSDKQVCHSCDNPKCVNPDHLFLGTHQENTDDKVRKNRAFRPVMRRILSDSQVLEIRELAKTEKRKVLAVRFGVCQSTICKIVSLKHRVNLFKRKLS